MKPKEPQKQNTDQAGPAHRMLERLVEALSRSVDQMDPDIGELEGLVDEARALLELYRAARAAQPAATTTPPADEQDRSQLSDGYHTFAELYEHRHSLMLAFMASRPDLCWFSKRHADGQLPFGSEDWFIVGANLPTGLITYHLPIELFSAARKTGADELPVGMEWDGHTANDVAKRLREWVEQRPGTQNAMIFARSVLEGWANYGRWVWPESALEGVKRDTTEAIKVLNDALSGRSSDSLVTPADPGALTTPHPRTGPLFLCPEVGMLLQSTEQQGGGLAGNSGYASVAPAGVSAEELADSLPANAWAGPEGYSRQAFAQHLLDHPKIGPLLRGEGAPAQKRVVLVRHPSMAGFGGFGNDYRDGYRDGWAALYAEVERQQGGQADG